MKPRFFAIVAGAALALGLSATANAQDTVLNAVAVQVKSGQLNTYVERVKSLQGIMDRVGASGTVRAWQSTLAGDAAGTVFVSIEYPSLAAWADSTGKTSADAEWQKLLGGLDDIRTLQSSSLYRQVSGAAAGEITADTVLQTVAVRVMPGKLDEYVARVGELQAASSAAGASSQMRVWQATVAGQGTGTVVVGIAHPSLAAYAENTSKMQANAEWQKTIGGLDDIRTVVGSSLARNLGL